MLTNISHRSHPVSQSSSHAFHIKVESTKQSKVREVDEALHEYPSWTRKHHGPWSRASLLLWWREKKENMYIQSLLADAVRECSSVAEGCYGAAAAAHH